MGSSASRGQIEEFAVDFVNESVKVIQFEGDRLNVQGFLAAPTVKLLSVENNTKKLYQKNNLFDGNGDLTLPSKRGNLEPEASDVVTVAPEKLVSEALPSEYRRTLGNLGNLQRRAATMNQSTSAIGGAGDSVLTIPYHEIESLGDIPSDSAQLEFYFQLRLRGSWEMSADEKIIIRFPTKKLIHDNPSITKTSFSKNQPNIVYQVQALSLGGSWTTIGRASDGNQLQFSSPEGGETNEGIRMDRLQAAMGAGWVEKMTIDGEFRWIRIQMVTLSAGGGGFKYDVDGHRWRDLGGIQLQSYASVIQLDELMDIANPMFFMNPTAGSLITETVFQGAAPDYLDYDLVNPNVMVSFRAVSRTGMTILTSSRFTGTIKYLVSNAG